MLSIKLAFKNLLGAGLKTWLNVIVLSFAFVVIVFYNGMLDGWNNQALNDTIDWEVAHGQLWHPDYDKYDIFSLADANEELSSEVNKFVESEEITPILITQGTIYPDGRPMNILIKGIEPDQEILALPSKQLIKDDEDDVTAIIGSSMARSTGLKKGDRVLIQWRDKNGVFDAAEIVISEVFATDVPSVDHGQIWIPLERHRDMTGLTNSATLLVAGDQYTGESIDIWEFKDRDYLLSEFRQLMNTKKGASKLINGMLLAIALLAIFDTQVLSVFRRQREIGTYIALGMTRSRVVKIFTIEGSAHSILALIVGALYGIPALIWLKKTGIPLPASTEDIGIAVGESLIPEYSVGMISTTILLVVISATIVSYFPAGKIARMKPTDAIKGKIQ